MSVARRALPGAATPDYRAAVNGVAQYSDAAHRVSSNRGREPAALSASDTCPSRPGRGDAVTIQARSDLVERYRVTPDFRTRQPVTWSQSYSSGSATAVWPGEESDYPPGRIAAWLSGRSESHVPAERVPDASLAVEIGQRRRPS